MEEVSKRPDIRTQTCTVRTREGRLPDLAALKQAVDDLGIGARLRGVEATVEGELVWSDGEPNLRLAGSEDVLRLESYRHVVQWNFREKRAGRIRDAERGAFRKLVRDSGSASRTVRIVGPLRRVNGSDTPVLEVRKFEWIPR